MMNDIIEIFILNIKNVYDEVEKICDKNNVNVVVKNEILEEIKSILPK